MTRRPASEARIAAAREIVEASGAVHAAVQIAKKHGIPRTTFLQMVELIWVQSHLEGGA